MSRILFVMRYPQYMRMYATTVLALAARGHDVLLAYDNVDAASGDRLVPDGAPDNVRAIGCVPAHGGRWRDLLVDLGCTIDYIRFLSSHEGTPYLRERMGKYLPPRVAWLRRAGSWPSWAVGGSVAASRAIERAVPVDPALVEYLRGIKPDMMVVTPLVLRGPGGVQQTQLVKAARRLRIPVALGVGSWDHLSSKGLIRVGLDRVIVWNDIQKREAVAMHGVAPDSVVVTGAQLFDGWFGRQPSVTRERFLERVGLRADRPMVLYAGSSRGIAKPALEIPFVRQWLAALRASSDPAVRTASVLVRPHYSNMHAWQHEQLDDAAAVVWPRQRPSLPMTDLDASDYFHSMYFSAAVVGINTSAMIEASIVGRPVFTIEVPEFEPTQAGTTHFHYLVERGGGCVESAADFAAHVEQIRRALADPGHGAGPRRRFVEHFVRPHGLDRPALDHVVAAIEGLAGSRRPAPAASSPVALAQTMETGAKVRR